MNNKIQESYSISRCRTKEGLHIVFEFLVFFAVFIVGSIAEGIAIIPCLVQYLFNNQDFADAVNNGDYSKLDKISNSLLTSDSLMIISLFATSLMIIIVLLFCKLIQKRKMDSIGFIKKGFIKEYAIGMVLGLVMFSIVVGLGVLFGGLSYEGIATDFAIGTFALYFIGYLIQGMSEEVLCRGYFLGSVARRNSVVAAILANSVFFAALHLANTGISLFAFINLSLFGIFASLLFIRRGSIWCVAAVHSIWNLVQGNVYGLSVSGTNSNLSIFKFDSNDVSDIFTGGAFGMEGSICCTIVLLTGIIILYFMKNHDLVENTSSQVVYEN